MKYGHRGANHPVKDLETGRVYISSQNHGYMVKADSVPEDVAEVAFVNVNDGTVEGLKYKNKKTMVDGFKFDSEMESHYYLYLKQLKEMLSIKAKKQVFFENY